MFSLNKLKMAFLLYCCFLFGFTLKVLPQSEIWTTKSPMPTPRILCSACEVDGVIYVIGGCTTQSYPWAVPTVEAYDIATDTWTTKADMLTARLGLGTGCVNGKIYAIGGGDNNLNRGNISWTNMVDEYDPKTDSWQRKTGMPTPRTYFEAVTIDNLIYVIGGKHHTSVKQANEVYDPETDTWTKLEDMPTGRNYLAACSAGCKIYVLGGAVGVSEGQLGNNEEYDTVLNKWFIRKDMPTPRFFLSASSVNGKVYAIGGGTQFYQPTLTTVEAYDPSTDSWSRMTSMPTPRYMHTTCTVDGKIYVFGGTRSGGETGIVETVEVYDPSLDFRAILGNVNVSKTYATAGNDSICISARLNNPTGVTLVAAIETLNQTQIDSLQLNDDGLHSDAKAGDSLYANIWHIDSKEEQQYYVDLNVKQVDTDTLEWCMNNAAVFTTIGPIVLESFIIDSSDINPNPGDKIKLQLTLKNNGLEAAAKSVRASIIPLDSCANVPGSFIFFGDIEAQTTLSRDAFYTIEFSKDCPVGKEIPFRVNLSSGNNYTLWSDTFSIVVESPHEMVKTDREIPQEFGLFQNYPNPFNAETTITLFLPKDEFVNLEVYNTLGQKVTTLESDLLAAGRYKYTWQAINQPSGLYFYRIATADFSETYKMLLVR